MDDGISLRSMNECCCFLEVPGWMLLFATYLLMEASISWWSLDGCCYSLVVSVWMVVFLGGPWKDAAIPLWSLAVISEWSLGHPTHDQQEDCNAW